MDGLDFGALLDPGVIGTIALDEAADSGAGGAGWAVGPEPVDGALGALELEVSVLGGDAELDGEALDSSAYPALILTVDRTAIAAATTAPRRTR
ncbi:MAG: hypothetical protein ABI137_15040 [Antricoccus sp.]